ncbi:hypothetical protein G6F56_012341 [Rhizopus delemar]|nr:hypothetical protein G6F56_012341 [Rhizopus delemar]
MGIQYNSAPLALQSSSEDQVSTGMKEASGMTEEERVLELRLMLQKAEEDAAVARAAIASNASNKRRKTTQQKATSENSSDEE